MTGMSGAAPTLLLVVGAGRSGTSTVAGTLSRLGFVVPSPEVPADETNPRGFYEPQWVVDFHNQLLTRIGTRTNDARPGALAMTRAVAEDAEVLAELEGWLREQTGNPRTLVKDPRTFWFHDLWRKASGNIGMELAFVTMLRHPAAVARSRDTYYFADREAETRRARETTNVAAWCHSIVVSERLAREDPRAFVRYEDLMSDWRAAIRHADESLGLGLAEAFTDAPHPVDDFIEPSLNRSVVTWDDLSVYPEVSDLAEDVWATVNRLVDDPADADAITTMDVLHERYDRLYTFATDITLDQTMVDRQAHMRRVNELKDRVQRLRGRVQGLETDNARLEDDLRLARRSLTNRVASRLRRLR